MRISSWNVNGIRSCHEKGALRPWLESGAGDIVGLQEVRAPEAAIPLALREGSHGFHHVVAARKAGYSGVALFARRPPDELETSLGEDRFDDEGRLQIARFGPLCVANVYFPNGSGNEANPNGRVPYKLDFYRALFDRLADLRAQGRRVLVMGDFNTAHKPIDLARPRENEQTSGFLPEERAELDRWLAAGWVDTFRAFDPAPGRYSWWSFRMRARERNVGWRIDYVLACPAAMAFVRAAAIHTEVMGSDHCPVSVEVDSAILSG